MSANSVLTDLKFLKNMTYKRMGHPWHQGSFVRIAYVNTNDSLRTIKRVCKSLELNCTVHIYRDTNVLLSSTLPYEIVIGTKFENCEINIIKKEIILNQEMIDCPMFSISNSVFYSGQGSIFIPTHSGNGIKIRRRRYKEYLGDVFRYFVLKYQHTLLKYFEDQEILVKSYGLVKAVYDNKKRTHFRVSDTEHKLVDHPKTMEYLKSPRYAIIQEKVHVPTMSIEECRENKKRVDKLIKEFCGFRCWNRDPKPDSFGINKNGKLVLFDVDQFVTKLTIIEALEPIHGPNFKIHSDITPKDITPEDVYQKGNIYDKIKTYYRRSKTTRF